MAEQKYRVIKRLEAGGMAEVYLGEAVSMEGFKKTVAIKRVLPHLAQNRNFIAMFLDEAKRVLEASREALTRGDAPGLREHAHSLKGASANMGARQMIETADQLEKLGEIGEIGRAGAVMDQLEARFHEVRTYLKAITL